MKDRKDKKCQCLVRENSKFLGAKDFYNFFKTLSADPNFQKVIPTQNLYSKVGFEENWYQCLTCGQIWRLVSPDPPFAGVWEIIDDKSIHSI